MSSRILAAAFTALLVLPLQALGFELVPISREFTPSGSGATQSYEVTNEGTEPVAINVSVVSRALDSAGAESNQSAEDDFLVYPPQFVVAPGGRQTLRVSWLGNPTPQRELSYRLVVEQLPIERYKVKPSGGAPSAGAVTVLKRYMGSLYVRPAKTRADLEVRSARLARGAHGEPQLIVAVHNRGTAHASWKDYALQMKGPGRQPAVLVSPATLQLKSSVVLADGTAELHLPWPHGFEPAEVRAVPRPRD